MVPYTDPVGGQLKEGESTWMVFYIAPGKCYSIASTGFGVQDIELEFSVWPPYPQTLVERRSGEHPIIGELKSGCFEQVSSTGSTGKVVIRANRGSGLAFARVYAD